MNSRFRELTKRHRYLVSACLVLLGAFLGAWTSLFFFAQKAVPSYERLTTATNLSPSTPTLTPAPAPAPAPSPSPTSSPSPGGGQLDQGETEQPPLASLKADLLSRPDVVGAIKQMSPKQQLGFLSELSSIDKQFKTSNGLNSSTRTPVSYTQPKQNIGVQGLQEPERAAPNGQYAVVRVFYGTDRAPAEKVGEFTALKAQSITYGSVDVSIPRNHVLGGLESPSLLRLEFHSDPTQHVTVLKINVSGYQQFISELRSKALNATTPSVLLFVHGYNVSFEDAARRTAQMAYDLDFRGAPVFFSWPSYGDPARYPADSQALERAQPDLETFVTQILTASPNANVYVIAHSMGNRGMTKALLEFAKAHPSEASRIKEIVLAAPDIDTDVFVHQIAPKLVELNKPVTLYVSSKDVALSLSEKFNAGPRAGDAGKSIVLMTGIETIDASAVDTDFLGHSYIGDRRSVLADLYYLINGDIRAKNRFGLRSQRREGQEYWVFAP